MKREHALRQQLMSLGMLGEAVDAMKSLSAHHLRTARIGLVAARLYREGIDRLLTATRVAQPTSGAEPGALLLVAADLGLCDGYNQRLVDAALALRSASAGPFYCIGRRPLPALRRAQVPVARQYTAATSVEGLSRLLLTLADDVLGDYMHGHYGTLAVISARFEGVGAFTPTVSTVLPIGSRRAGPPPMPTPYASPASLVRTLVREYLYSTLYELLLDALASEHGTRLVATESAGEWLGRQRGQVRARLTSVRQEASTQEVLDVASGAKLRRRTR